MAITDTDSKTLFWFVDNRFVGKVKRDQPFFWKPKIGTFNVSVVDNLGRGSSNTIHVKIVQ